MTRTSGALKVVKDDVNGPVRIRTVCCGLKKAVPSEGIRRYMREHAVCAGISKHAVSVIANELILRNPSAVVTDWFLWYTRVWSAIDYHIDSSGLKGSNPMIPDVNALLIERPDMFNQLNLARGRRRCNVIGRQQECNALMVATLQHFCSFRDRLVRYTRVLATQILWDTLSDAKNAVDVSKVMSNFILGDPEHANVDALRQKLLAISSNDAAADALSKAAEHERTLLGALVSGATTERWFASQSKQKHAYRLVPHLIRYSSFMTHVLQTEFGTASSEDVDDDAEVDNEHGEEEQSSLSTSKKWTKDRTPRPFTILPITKLRASMAYYGYTEVDAMYGEIHDAENAAYGEHIKRTGSSKKRKSPDARPESLPEPPKRFYPDKVNFAATVLAEELPIDNAKSLGTLICFRTDGIQLSATFASGASSIQGISELVEKGYSGIQFCKGEDVATLKRGLWRVGQSEGSLSCTNSDFDLIAVDPGVCKPLQWCTVAADCDENSICSNSTRENITSDAWVRHSGRADRNAWEMSRREMNRAYAEALNSASSCIRRTTCIPAFNAYGDWVFETIVVRSSELCHHRRSLKRWLAHRRLQSFLSTVADRMLNRTSHRVRNKLTNGLLTTEERVELHSRLKRRLAEKKHNKEKHHVVFFGDGTYSHMRGHAAVPRKSILHELGVRAPTILIDEFKTSKHCFCGRALTDAPNASRVRVHQDGGGDCAAFQCGICDRDELATMNIALASLRCLARQPWPTHLKRQPS